MAGPDLFFHHLSPTIVSQHFIHTTAKTGEPLEAMCGYDRPYHHFFVSIRPDSNDEDLHARKDLNYESMYTKRGGLVLHQVAEVLEQYNFEVPYGLLQVMEQDSLLDQQASSRGEIRNKRTHWPLKGLELKKHLDFMDRHVVGSVLANDEESSDNELIDLLVDQTKQLTPQMIHELVTIERPKFFTNPMHSIDWACYGNKAEGKEQTHV